MSTQLSISDVIAVENLPPFPVNINQPKLMAFVNAASQLNSESYNTLTNKRRKPVANNRNSNENNWRIAIKI